MGEAFIIVDRDGVINEDSDDYIKGVDEWKPIAGSIEALARLYHAGYRICVVTNQSGIGRGLFGLAELNAMHRKLRDLLAAQGGQLELIAFCPHTPATGCRCRKPQPGLLRAVGERLGVSLVGAPFIGDSITDILAARAAQMLPLLVRTGKGEATLEREHESLRGVAAFRNLSAAADHVLERGYGP